MLIAKIIGNVVSTIKNHDYDNRKLLIVRAMNLDGSLYGPELIALDACDVDAGIGDMVLLDQEGGGARQMVHIDHLGPIECVVAAVIDHIVTDQGSLYQFGGGE